jgi:predicted DNA-binding transcriptional regulator AlpA
MKLLRFQDLKDVLKSRTTLNDWVDNRGFPPGRVIGKHRLWTEDEILRWIESQPTGKLPLRGDAKRRKAAAAHE